MSTSRSFAGSRPSPEPGAGAAVEARAAAPGRPGPLARFFWWLARQGRTGGGRAGGVLRIWLWWERLELRLHPVTRLRPGSVYEVGRAVYRGGPRTLSDGTALRRGDPVLELHFDNAAIARASEAMGWSPWQVTRDTRADLAWLGRRIHDGDYGPVRAVYAESLYALALRRMGFDAAPMPQTWHAHLQRYFMVGLLAVYHPHGWEGAARARARGWPAEAWASPGALDILAART